jgi:hypothetical protein
MSPVATAVEGKLHGSGPPAGGSLREKRSPEPVYSVPQAPTLATAKPAPAVPALLPPAFLAPQPRSAADVGALHSIYGNAAVARAATRGEIAPAPRLSAAPILPMPTIAAPKAAAAAGPAPLGKVPPAPMISEPAAASAPRTAVALPTAVPPASSATGAAPLAAKPSAPIVAETKQDISPIGQSLPPHVQEAIESSLSVNLDGAEVHADSRANAAAQTLSARAFAYGKHIFLGKDEKIGDLRLIAHEATHVVQQQGVPSIHRSAPGQSDAYEQEAERASSAVMRGEKFTVSERVTSPRVQRWGLSDALDKFAEWANAIPGFRMFTIVLGVNPINMSPVQRSAANILRAVVEFMPGGALIVLALDKYGVFDKVGNWVDQQIRTLGLVGSSIKKAVDDFLNGLHLSDILDLGGVWERAKRIFTEPIDRIKNFVVGLVDGILQFIKDAILMPLAKLAEGTRGWDLLIAVLGKNPITGDPVPRTADTLIGGFMKLIGQEEVWNNIKKANAIARAWAWFQGAVTGLIGFVSQIPSLFIQALKSLVIADIVVLPNAFIKIAKVFGDFVGKFITWAGNSVWTLLQIIFEVVAPAVMPYLKRVGAAFKSILQNPIAFVKNLVAAAKLGFENFGANFLEHLKAGLIDWLTGSLPGVYIPKAISLPEMGKFAMSVLGITWAQIRGKIVKALGPNGDKIMTALETAFDIVVALVKGGPAAAWELIKEKLTNLKDMVIEGITSFVIDTIVKKAIPKIISMFIPGAGFISAIVSIYDTVKVFVEKLAKMAAAVKAFVDSVVEIAEGQIGGAAKKVETALAGLLSLAISFLAGFLGLGDVASKILAVIEKVRAAVDKALDTAIAWVVDKAKALFAKLFGKGDDRTDEQKQEDLDKGMKEAEALQKVPNTTEAQIRKGLLSIKAKYKMTSLELVVDSEDESKETVHVEGEINPGKKGEPDVVAKSGKIESIHIPRPPDFSPATAKELLSQAAKILGTDPEKVSYRAAGLARRHVISSKDVAEHYESNLKGLTFAAAKEKLDPKLGEHGIQPVALTGNEKTDADTILERAKALHEKFFNDLSNLFVDEARENSSIGRAMDPKHPEIGLEGLDAHIEDIEEKYAIDKLKTTPVKD